MESALKPDFSGPLKYRHQEDKWEKEGEGHRVIVSARGTRKPATQEQRNARLRYAHLKDEDYDTVSSLLQGTLQLSQVPRIKSKVIKMFISSTFKDLEVERNILAQQVFPKLRTYCRDKYGVDFQAVDMRWGISPGAKDDHSGAELCLAELAHCQNCSIGPNFALMLGQRYGFRQVPAAIVKIQFDALRTHLEENGSDVTLLDKCYERDMNVIPSMYRLQTVSKITESTQLAWAEVETSLKQLIEEGGRLAVKASDLRQDELRSLMASMTELEVYEGLINIPKQQDRQNNCLVFERQIDDLYDHLDHPLARRFCDVINGEAETDGNAQAALHDLKLMAQRAVPRFNFCSTKVSWTGKGIDPEDHRDHVQLLTDHFYHTTRALVDRNMLRYDQLAADELYHEVVAHWNMVTARCLTFVGREVPLMSIREYLSQESSQILVVHGESGVGKTSFLAKVTSLVHSWMAALPNTMKTSLVVRFVGISPKCSTIQQLLYSICHQVAFVCGRPRQEVPEDYKSLKVYFIDLLQRGEVPGRLVILLDSLDQLSSTNAAHKLDWLPARVAPNVKIIVSTLLNKYNILTRLKAKTEDSKVMHLSPLPTTDAERIMKVLLDSTSRQVTLPQWRLIQQAFQHCTLPLFITLTFQEAARWRSYDEVPANALQHTIEASIHKLLERLEDKHGKTFVSHSLGYITAARRGLSESELEDVLSLDDQVLNSIFVFWQPPTRRVPPSLWPRLFLDIAAFLVERDADEVSVLSWYHQQFVDAAQARYLGKDSVRREHVYRTLAEYFQGAWSGSAQKPFTYSKAVMSRLRLDSDQGKACRFVPDMPLVFRSSEVSERFNLRKMSELPFALLFSYQFDLLRSACFCNYQWLHAKLRATSVQQVLADFALFDDPETDLVADVLRMSGTTLHQDPDRLGTEISGRLLPHIARYPAIRELVKQCDLAAQMCCPLVPVAQLYAAPGGPLQYECDLEARSAVDVDVFSSPDGILMTAKSYYSTCLKVWELSQGEPRQDIHLPIGQVHPSSDGRYLAILRENRHVSIYDAHTGQIHGHVDYDYGEVGSVARSRKYLAISVERGTGPIVIDLEAAALVHRFHCQSRTVAISPDEKLLCFNTGSYLMLYSLPLMEKVCVSKSCCDVPRILQFAGDSKCFVLTESKMLQSVLFDPVNRGHYTNKILSDLDMRDITLSHNRNLLLCRCGRWLYLVDALRERMVYRLQHCPDEVFKMTLTNFSGAGFTPDDRLVVASRHTYLFVWAASSGAPVRVLQAAVTPVAKLFMSPATNKAVTLLQDNTLQVWNLNNLDADVLHTNHILKGAVKTLTVSTSAGLVACHSGGQGQAEVKLVDIGTGRVKGTLEHDESVEHVSSVSFSPGGRYLLTWNVCVPGYTGEGDKGGDHDDDHGQQRERLPCDWDILRRVVLWQVDKRKPVYSKDSTRFAIFDQHGAALAVVQCVFFSRTDWTENLYKVSVIPLDSNISGTREVCFGLPELTEFVGQPVLYHDRRNRCWAFVAVLQYCTKTYPRLKGVEGPRSFESVVFVQFLPQGGSSKPDTEPTILKLADLVRFPEENDRLAGVRVEASNLLLITYVKHAQQQQHQQQQQRYYYAFDASRGLLVPPGLEKGCLGYDLGKGLVVSHRVRIFTASTDLQLLQMSQTSSVCLDQTLQVFDMMRAKRLCQIEAEWNRGSARLALDGHYVLALSADCRSLQVCRTVDGALKGTVKLHGKGTHLQVAEDDRTIAVGTTDGRVLLLLLVLEVSDPYVELIHHLPSRNPPPPPPPLLAEGQGQGAEGGGLMERDAEVIRGSAPELSRLSAKIRSDLHEQFHRRSSFRAISNAVMVAQRVRSQACCIQ